MKQTKQHAEEIGKKTSERLGPGWSCRVWDNVGWHVAWDNGAVKLHYDHWADNYWAMIGEVGSAGGLPDLTPETIFHSKSPVLAVLKAIMYANEQLRNQIDPIRESMGSVLGSIEEASLGRINNG